MGKFKGAKLNTKLLAVFFVAIFLISLVSSVVFFRLLDTLEEETRAVNTEQFNGTVGRLDMELNKIFSNYYALMQLEMFENYSDPEISTTKLIQMSGVATNVLTSSDNIFGWSIFLNNTDKVITRKGTYDIREYVANRYVAEGFDAEFWQKCLEERFAKTFFPEATFTIDQGDGAAQCVHCVPLALKSYWKNNLMVVIFLDMEALRGAAGCDWEKGFYIFTEDGALLYSTPDDLLTALPQAGTLSLDGEKYEVLQTRIQDKGLHLVRLVPETEAAGLVRGSLTFFVTTMLVSLGITSVFAVLSIRAAIHPVNDMLDLLARHSGLPNSGDVRMAHNVLHQVLKNLADQALSLAQKDAVLSEYLLRSHLSNVHVNVGPRMEMPMGLTYILFIQIRYRHVPENAFPVRRSELESLMQEMLSGILQRLFESSITFQLEPGRFAARVIPGDRDMDSRMEALMARLDQEKEFAWFTVVQSEAVQESEDLSTVYTRILEAARQARIREESQLLRLPMEERGAESAFSKGDEQRLQRAVVAGKPEEAVACVREILTQNARLDICYSQLETLCVILVNTAASGAQIRYGGKSMIDAAGAVLNALVTKCDSFGEYRAVTVEFVSRMAGASLEEADRDPLLCRVEQYLEDNYSRDFSAEEMADALGISRSYLSTYYKSKTGMNLSDSIQQFRVKKAMELLQDRNIRVSDVGSAVGFVSASTFQRQFKNFTGMTPKEYRMKNT